MDGVTVTAHRAVMGRFETLCALWRAAHTAWLKHRDTGTWKLQLTSKQSSDMLDSVVSTMNHMQPYHWSNNCIEISKRLQQQDTNSADAHPVTLEA